MSAAQQIGFEIDWRLMSLAVLNEGRELPPIQQARMVDSRRVGRLMAALREELGADVIGKAYVAFATRYFDGETAVDDELAELVAREVGARRTGASALNDADFDTTVATFHRASQDALGDVGGSPLLTIDGHTVFGPVFTAVPDSTETLAAFRAVDTLVRMPVFSQLERPRAHV